MEVVKHYADFELIKAVQSGDEMEQALKFMYRSYFRILSAYVTDNQGSSEDAEDIFQEVLVTFIQLIQNNKFRGESSIRTFLYAMNRNIWLNELKKRKSQQARNSRFETQKVKVDPDMEYIISGRETRKQIIDIIEQLGDVCKTILLAFYYENLSMKEILERLHFENEQVVRNKKYKCLKQLEKIIGENPAIASALKNSLYYE